VKGSAGRVVDAVCHELSKREESEGKMSHGALRKLRTSSASHRAVLQVWTKV
jgi:hypothetical protein